MALSTPIPPMTGVDLAQLINATQHVAAATLAAALITAAGRPHSVDEALNLLHDIQYSLHPGSFLPGSPGSGPYQAWQQSKQTDKAHV
jgi:hypothetical protein